MNWAEVVETLGGMAVLGAVFAYLGKTAVDAYVSGRVESYKSDLQRAATEHSVRFQRLHAERAESIRDLYGRISHLDETLSSTLRFFQSIDEPKLSEKVAALSVEFNELRAFYLPRKIFFAPATCELIESILEIARNIFYDITTYEVDTSHPEYKFNREVLLERHEFWEKARAAHRKEFAELKAKLENEFRGILGIEA